MGPARPSSRAVGSLRPTDSQEADTRRKVSIGRTSVPRGSAIAGLFRHLECLVQPAGDPCRP